MPAVNHRKYLESWEKRGQWYIQPHPKGGFSIWKEDMRKKGVYVPPQDVVSDRYVSEIQRSGKMSFTTQTYLGYYGIVSCGERSAMEGRKFLGLDIPMTEQQAREVVTRYWAAKNPDGSPNNFSTSSPKEFSTNNPRVYKYISRHCGGLKKVLESIYPGKYHQVSDRRAPVKSGDREKLAATLISRFCAGNAISPRYLRSSPLQHERELKRKIVDIAKDEKDIFDQKKASVKVVSELTGLKSEEINLNQGAQANAAKISEQITRFLFAWRSALNLNTLNLDANEPLYLEESEPEIAGVEEEPIYVSLDMRKFTDGENMMVADLRIGNHPIEVKTALSKGHNYRLKAVPEKYNPGKNIWVSGENMDSLILVLHCAEETYKREKPKFQQAGISVLGYTQFHELLAETIGKIREHRPHIESEVRPSMPLELITQLHEEVSLHPFLLVREGNFERREWMYHCLDALIKHAKHRGAKV